MGYFFYSSIFQYPLYTQKTVKRQQIQQQKPVRSKMLNSVYLLGLGSIQVYILRKS